MHLLLAVDTEIEGSAFLCETDLLKENGEPKAVIHQRKPDEPKRWGQRGAERLANWSRPELSCEGLVENLGSGWARVKPMPSTATTESSTGGLSKKLAGLSGSKWTRAVRQIQKNKSVSHVSSSHNAVDTTE